MPIICLHISLCWKRTWVCLPTLSLFVATESAHNAWMRGWRAGWCWLRKLLCGCARAIILAHNLLRQSKAWSWVPVRLPFLQGTEEAGCADHVGVRPSGRNFNTAVNPATHVQNNFVYFRCRKSTQTRNYYHSLLSKHAININNKQRKIFLLLLAVITVLILLLLVPSINVLIH